jgi:hypothetical protein
METDIVEIRQTLYGSDSRSGIVRDVNILMEAYKDVKRVGMAIIAGVIVNLIGILILLARGG